MHLIISKGSNFIKRLSVLWHDLAAMKREKMFVQGFYWDQIKPWPWLDWAKGRKNINIMQIYYIYFVVKCLADFSTGFCSFDLWHIWMYLHVYNTCMYIHNIKRCTWFSKSCSSLRMLNIIHSKNNTITVFQTSDI